MPIRLVAGLALVSFLSPVAGAQRGVDRPALAREPIHVELVGRPPDESPPAAWQSQDPADSLYRRARQDLNRNDYAGAADLFREIRRRYPRSDHAPDAYYWEAYARYRIGGAAALREARALLAQQREAHPRASTRREGDAESLETRVLSELARLGDEDAAGRLAVITERSARTPPTPPRPRTPPTPPRPPTPPTPGVGRSQAERCAGDDDVQTMAINAVLNMDAQRALPILERVLARRDAESLCLRRRAVFIISQHRHDRVERILLDAARNDPDLEVRSQAVFWLSQVNTPGAVAALQQILAASPDREVQDKAIFALSQHNSPEARRALHAYAGRRDASNELREKAVFWIGQSNDPESVEFLQRLYGQVESATLKERIIFSISQNSRGSSDWFAQIARNRNEPIELRKKALFWMGQRSGTSGAELAAAYDSFQDPEVKDQLIFVLSQKHDRAAVDKLFDIARREQDKELRKKAIFWLTQTNDPRVADMIAELLGRP